MKTPSNRAARAAIAALLLCAVFGAAQAQQRYETVPSAGAAAARALAERRQRMIDSCERNYGTDCAREVDTELRTEAPQWVPSLRDEPEEQVAARALADRRQKMIDYCEQNRGTDCVREVDTELRAEALQQSGRVIRLRPGR